MKIESNSFNAEITDFTLTGYNSYMNDGDCNTAFDKRWVETNHELQISCDPIFGGGVFAEPERVTLTFQGFVNNGGLCIAITHKVFTANIKSVVKEGEHFYYDQDSTTIKFDVVREVETFTEYKRLVI